MSASLIILGRQGIIILYVCRIITLEEGRGGSICPCCCRKRLQASELSYTGGVFHISCVQWLLPRGACALLKQ